jgi:hypothetical protein
LETVDAMYLEGLEMKRQRLRREHPTADEPAIEAMLRAWIDDRPPDAPGRVVRP